MTIALRVQSRFGVADPGLGFMALNLNDSIFRGCFVVVFVFSVMDCGVLKVRGEKVLVKQLEGS